VTGRAGIYTAERILDATVATMTVHGIARLSLEDVARRAGVSRQTVYRYFPSKRALVHAAVLREEAGFLENVTSASDGHRRFEDALQAAIEAALRTGREHALLNRLLATEPQALLPLVTTDTGPVLSAARQALGAVLGSHLPGLPAACLDSAADTLARLLVSHVINPAGDPPAAVAARLTGLLVHGLAGAAPPPK